MSFLTRVDLSIDYHIFCPGHPDHGFYVKRHMESMLPGDLNDGS